MISLFISEKSFIKLSFFPVILWSVFVSAFLLDLSFLGGRSSVWYNECCVCIPLLWDDLWSSRCCKSRISQLFQRDINAKVTAIGKTWWKWIWIHGYKMMKKQSLGFMCHLRICMYACVRVCVCACTHFHLIKKK